MRGYTGLYFQINLLEQDMSDALCLLRSIKNTFSPINRIPPEVLSLLPDYWDCQHYWDRQSADQDLISLTHVCRSWRAIFTSNSLLWTRLDCKNANKTRVYIKRSRTLPLEISLTESGYISYHDNALLAAASCTNRLSSLVIYRSSKGLQDLLDYFPFPTLLLKELKIVLRRVFGSDATIPGVTFPEDLSSLRKLSLSCVVTHLPWRNLSNLTEFEFCRSMLEDLPTVTQLLDFFESAPLLRKIVLRSSIPNHFSVPPDRVVPLPNLDRLTVINFPVHSTFFDHLSIPPGASMDLRFYVPTHRPQTPVCLDNNFGNLYHITTINLLLDTSFWTSVRLSGPSGDLRMNGCQIGRGSSIVQSLRKFDISKTQMLSITGSPSRNDTTEDLSIFQLLPLMDDLHTLALIQVDHRRLIRVLNPRRNESRTVLCSQLRELVLYFERWERARVKELVEMVSERAKRRSKLSSITTVSLGGYYPWKEISLLQKYVSHVEYAAEDSPPGWDTVFGGVGGGGYDNDWNAFPYEDGCYDGGYDDDDDDDDDSSGSE